VFDASGKYLYFAASTDAGPASQNWGDLSSFNRPVTRSLYLVVLDKTLPSPLAPESDEEKAKDPEKKKEASAADAPKDDTGNKDGGQGRQGRQERRGKTCRR